MTNKRVELEDINRAALAFFSALLEGQKVGTAPGFTATIGLASTQVLATQAARIHSLIINDSDTDIYLALGEAAVLNKGPKLLPGGVFEISWYNLYTGAINAICATANKVLCGMDART